jgi:hypothetical protein
MYLSLKIPTNNTVDFCSFFGLRLVNYVEIEIGGQKIDKHYSHWLYVWNELSLPKSKRDGYNKMVGQAGGTLADQTLYVPLEFWFCRNVGLALPLIALQYHEVKINIQFETAALCRGNSTDLSAFPNATLWVDYVFLDTDERRRFAQLSHEYLIEQLQFTGSESISSTKLNSKLSFNHPCKELVWFASKKSVASGTTQETTNNNWFNYTTSQDAINITTNAHYNKNLLHNKAVSSSSITAMNPITTAKLILNGNDRFSVRPGSYFNLIQPFQHHENIPTNAGINVYSFALKPEEHQPSGTLNMSRIDTATLSLDLNASLTATDMSSTLNVYAVNYNVLRILSGMGGLAYSN